MMRRISQSFRASLSDPCSSFFVQVGPGADGVDQVPLSLCDLYAQVVRRRARTILQLTRRSTRRRARPGPLIKHVNDSPEVWSSLWRAGVRLGLIPYYMFVERDTGARNYFEVPLVRAFEICKEAYACVSGLSRSVQGPSMSAFPAALKIYGSRDGSDSTQQSMTEMRSCHFPTFTTMPRERKRMRPWSFLALIIWPTAICPQSSSSTLPAAKP